MSLNKLSKAIGFQRFFAGQASPLASRTLVVKEKKEVSIMKQIGKSATPALLAMAASVGLVSAQTPFMIASVNSGQVLDV